MTSTIGQDYPRLLAPKADGELLIWPEPRQLLRQTWENHRQLRDGMEVKVLGLPLPRLRGWLRRWMGHSDDTQPIIATGHQTELYHPGVWIKNAAIDAAARRIGAQAIHFAVDTDAPKHLMYRWPGGSMPLTDDPNLTKARWTGLVKAPTAAHVADTRATLADASRGWDYEPAWPDLFDKLEEMAPHQLDLSTALTNAQHATDRGLGLRQQMFVCSPMWKTTAYLAFVYDLCSRADGFAQVYNAALAEFRQSYGIANPGRPMPDLNVESDWCEIPFWLDDLADYDRKRASLTRESGRWTLNANGSTFVFDTSVKDGWAAGESLAGWLGSQKLRLSPRALTLTTFLRMFVVDQFIHGIGGGLYDQVTDRILAEWYHCTPPAFSVVTATMFPPMAAGRERTCIRCITQEGRKLRHGLLGDRKMEIVREIASLPRHSTQRTLLFSRMHRELDDALATDPRVGDYTQRFEEARQRYSDDQVLFDRELPYTIQSRPRLEEMIAKVDRAFQA